MMRRRESPKQKLLPLVNLSPRARRVASAVFGSIYLLFAAGWLAATLGETDDRLLHGLLAAAFFVAAVGLFASLLVLTRRRR